MKLRKLIPSVIFLFGAMVSHAQINEAYYQGFEAGESAGYNLSASTAGETTTDVYRSGSQSFKLMQSSASNVYLMLDTLDFTGDPTLQYIALRFDHICNARHNSAADNGVAMVQYRLASQTDNDWVTLTGVNYNGDESFSTQFPFIGGFNLESYNEWALGVTDNTAWKSERFDINNALGASVPTAQRKLLIRFFLKRKTHNQAAGNWWFDNIKVSASSSLMVRPKLTMLDYPDGGNHPSSRGAHIVFEANTTLLEGISTDSTYITYRIADRPGTHRSYMTLVPGTTNRYEGYIPFEGYDTLMHFYCTARDATSNANAVTFPAAENAWVSYRCVRGTETAANPTLPQFNTNTGTTELPFPRQGAHRSEWIFDSALLASAGYGPGTITGFTYTIGANLNSTYSKTRYQIRMMNAPTNYSVDTVTTHTIPFITYDSYMKTVYDGPLSIPPANSGTRNTLQLQDSFHYAGKDIVMQVITSGSDNSSGINVRTIPVTGPKATIYYTLDGAGENPFVNNFYYAYLALNRRPAFVFTQHANLPLLHDLGISELVDPSYTTAMVQRPGSLTVKLKNYGVYNINAVRISYSIDDNINGYYDWQGDLAADQEETVVIANNNINLPAGYHTLRVWVEDTLTASNAQYRDHEPLNDTAFSQFIVCEGPLSGVRHIGGPTPDYNDIEEFLFSLSRCGVDDSLVVKLAPGYYPSFTMPTVNGLSAANYIVFEPLTDNVTLYSDNTMSAAAIANLEQVHHVRFRKINFVRRSGALTDMVTLGFTSINCRFENCTFTDSLANPAAALRISSLINTGYTDSLVIDRCTFTGGRIGIDIKGQAADILSRGNSVTRCTFYDQYENAISVQNQTGIVIDSNDIYDVLLSSSYALMIFECRGNTVITRNKVYTSHSAGGIGVSNTVGTQNNHILVANNMVVCNDDGIAASMRPPFNIIQATWTDVVYNTIKMTAPNRTNAAAATFGGGNNLENCRFVNNIMVTLDNNNCAFLYNPGTSTSNTVGHNVYYSRGPILNRMDAPYANLEAWMAALPSDNASISVNPNFLNGSLVDLRTYNRLIKGVGMPLANVTTDMYGTARSATASCPGAFEFVSLNYDFEPEALVSPLHETCHMPSPVELAVLIRNSGINSYTGSGLTLHYKINGGTEHQVAITQNIPAEDTITIRTGEMLQMPANGILDSTYTLDVWVTFTGDDPNQTNDANSFTVVSKYHPGTPGNDTVHLAYAHDTILDPTRGVDMWSVYNHTSAPQRKSQIYWYSDTTAAPFHVGRTLTTDTLRQDTVFYIQQRREQPIVRITQLEIARAATTVGVTPAANLPYWMNNNRKVVLQLTNVGDATVNLLGDTLITLSPQSSINNKRHVFGDISIEPGESLIVQYGAGNNQTYLPMTLLSNDISISINNANNSNVAFVLKHNGVVEDVVALNTAPTATYPANQAVNWTSMNIPSHVWQGPGVTMAFNAGAGLVRTGFNGDATDWRVATAAEPMFLHTIDPSWIRYSDNGCDGGFGTMTVMMINPPAADLAIDVPVLPESGCGLGDESVTVKVNNYGIEPVTSFVLNYCAGGDTVSETVTTGIPANGSITHTFAQQINLHFAKDSLVTVKVWANALAEDHTQLNDTNLATVTSLRTPDAPAALATRQVNYSERDTVTALGSALGLTPVWYDYNMNPVDTGLTHITEILYTGGTMGMAYIADIETERQVGTGTTKSGKNAYPNPYQPAKKYAKQQFIYVAADLLAAGIVPGQLTSLAFNLDSIYGTADTIRFDEYKISLGTTTDNTFTGNATWKSAPTVVYESNPFVLRRSSSRGWVTHPFSQPFVWDGVSNIVVQVVNYVATPYATGVQVNATSKSNTVISYNADNAPSPSIEGFVGNGNRNGNRPNIRFTNVTHDGCIGPMTPYTVQIVNAPAVDMAIAWPDGIENLTYNSCDSISFNVKLANQGTADMSNLKIYYQLDTLAVDSTTIGTTILSGQTATALMLKDKLHPGRHTLKAYIAPAGDVVTSNDSIEYSFAVRFCGGTYTIAKEGTPDYHTFGEAIDTLNAVGIEGPVVFNVSNGLYAEQVSLGAIPGSSVTNTVSFVGSGDSVLLSAATTSAANYVVNMNSTSNITFDNLMIESRPATGNYAHAIVMQDGDNINITNCRIKVKGSVNNATASCITLNGSISNLAMMNNVLDSGFYSIKCSGTTLNYNNITLSNNTFKNFWKGGVYLRGVTNIQVNSNEITSGVTTTGRDLIGVTLAQTAGDLRILKNKIYLIDDKNGGKVGILLQNINCTSTAPGLVANNMISCSGTGVAGLSSGLKPSGIWIDSSSTNLNIFFNSVRVYCGPYANVQYSEASQSFHSGTTVSNIQVMSNIFSNFSKGYAYYVAELNTISTSNFNAYYSASTRPLAWKQTTLATLADMQTVNNDDANSMFTEPFFTSERDLHLQITDMVAMAQYSSEVVDDIDGRTRPQIPAPTIGAHEKDITTHDVAIVRIDKPVVNPNPAHIESDPLWVKATFYNNGRSAESTVTWYAYIEGHEAETRTATRSIGPMQPSEMKTDSVLMNTVLGITGDQTIRVVVECADDAALDDNELTVPLYLAPAFNLAATKMATNRSGCELTDAVVKITIKNDGAKTMPAGSTIKIGYRAEVSSPANVVVPTLPIEHEETITLAADLLATRTTVIDFTQTANLYPTDTAIDIKVRITGWCKYEYDISPENDTTSGSQNATVDAYYTPAPPVGYDTTLAYGTWGAVRASQVNQRPIRWYRDSTGASFYHPSTYTSTNPSATYSTLWKNTPQYFSDSTYYLNCLSAKNCPSHFSAVTVHVAPRVPNDIAIEAILSPLGSRVYMENDTARVRIVNYGTSTQTNVPITFQVMRGTNVIQTETEICPTPIAPMQTLVYTFNTLVNISTPTTAQNYTMTAWTGLATDQVRRNDTIRTSHTFRSLAEYAAPTKPSHPSFDITRVSFNEIDFEIPALGRGMNNLALYANPDYPVTHVQRGMTDSLIVQVTSLNATDLANRCKIWVMIDFDRSGTFSNDEILVNGDVFYDNEIFRSLLTIAPSASYGYMRMRVVVGSNDDFALATTVPTGGVPADKNGHNIDFMLFVDAQPAATDLAITQIVAPRSYLVRDSLARVVSFRIANKGTTNLANPTINYSFAGEDGDNTGTVTFPGVLQPGTSGIVSLPAHTFSLGTTNLTLWHSTNGDNNHSNDTLKYEYHRFHIITLSMFDDFDSETMWYAPAGYNEYSRNYWELGAPAGAQISAAYSAPKAWVTDLDSEIRSGTRGNVSYLYSPIINTAQIRADTLRFYLRKRLNNGSTMHLEFYNFENKWQKAIDTSSREVWYNNTLDQVFEGNNNAYTQVWVPTSQFSGDFNEMLQLRFVYTAPIVTNANTNFGEGCAIDDFELSRARRRLDAGVVAIVEPTSPQYGETVYPEVLVQNFGSDTILSIRLGYTHYGASLAKESVFECFIEPDSVARFRFDQPFVVSSDFPQNFSIVAFSKLSTDIFKENDTCQKVFTLRPLDNDISAEEFVYPLERVIAGDTAVIVTMRIRNFGTAPISHATASYLVNGQGRVDEDIDFTELLGRPLASMEYFNYTFRQKIWASMGLMKLTGIIKCEGNSYIYNDTITKRVEGISSIMDLAAGAVVLDATGNGVKVQLVIDNVGALGANNFEVGYFIDNNPATTHTETYSHERPLPALTRGYHLFGTTLPSRPSGYQNVTGFVRIVNDNDPSNDSTKVQQMQLVNLRAIKLVIEENAQPECNVYLQVTNDGNMVHHSASIQLNATVNGASLSGSSNRTVAPGEILNLKLDGTLAKDRLQDYSGSGSLSSSRDTDPSNNQTSLIEVQSRVEGMPSVDGGNGLVLDQNYPNPFSQQTTVTFTLPNAATVRFFVVDAMGHLVNSFERHYEAGEQSLMLDMSSYGSGVYFYGIEVDGERRMRKMIMR